MAEPKYKFEIEFEVRDYECDLQGVVNNANYLHYLEHARHKFLLSTGVDFAKLHAEGVDPVVTRMEADYRQSLRSGDRFVVRSRVEMQGRLRMVFHQDVFRLPAGELVHRAVVTAAILKNGRPVPPEQMDERFRLMLD